MVPRVSILKFIGGRIIIKGTNLFTKIIFLKSQYRMMPFFFFALQITVMAVCMEAQVDKLEPIAGAKSIRWSVQCAVPQYLQRCLVCKYDTKIPKGVSQLPVTTMLVMQLKKSCYNIAKQLSFEINNFTSENDSTK